MLASIWWIKWPQLAGFQGRTCWENTGAARNASFTMAISMCLGRVLVSLWASGLLGHPSSFFRDAFSCNTAAPLFLPHKNSAKNMCMLTFTQQLGTWSWNTTWEIQVFFRVPCETLQEILEYASGGRQGSPRGISQGLTLTHGLLLLRVGCNLKVGHFDTKKHTPQVVNPIQEIPASHVITPSLNKNWLLVVKYHEMTSHLPRWIIHATPAPFVACPAGCDHGDVAHGALLRGASEARFVPGDERPKPWNGKHLKFEVV